MQLIPVMLALAVLGVERDEASFRPTMSEPDVPELFRLKAETFRYELEPVRESTRYTVSSLRFPSPIESPDPANNTVHAEYFRPRGDRRGPAVVVLHILGADFALSRYLAARLADRGVAALFIQLPYYGNRRPPAGNQRLLSEDIDQSVRSMRQGICDIRRGAAWLAGRPEVDPEKLGVTGISLGGILASVASAVDPALNRAVFLLAGGDLGEILWTMPESARHRRRWIASGRTKEDLKALTRPFDPLTHAHRLVGKKIFMMAGNVDEVIPPASARALWQAAGQPRIRWLDCGHYSAVGFMLPALRETVDFFAADLAVD